MVRKETFKISNAYICFFLIFILFYKMCVGKPSGGAVVQIPSQDLSWTMQDWELSQEPMGDLTQPQYCWNTFDAITMGMATSGFFIP